MAANLGILSLTTQLALSLSSAVQSYQLFPATQLPKFACEHSISIQTSTLSSHFQSCHWLGNCVSVLITILATCQRSQVLGVLFFLTTWWEWFARKMKAFAELKGWVVWMLPKRETQRDLNRRRERAKVKNEEENDVEATNRYQARRDSCDTGLLAGATLANIAKSEQPISRRRRPGVSGLLVVPARRAQEMYGPIPPCLWPPHSSMSRMVDEMVGHEFNGRYLDLDLPIACPPTA